MSQDNLSALLTVLFIWGDSRYTSYYFNCSNGVMSVVLFKNDKQIFRASDEDPAEILKEILNKIG